MLITNPSNPKLTKTASISQSSSSGVYADVPGATLTVVCTGRPIIVGLMSDSSGSGQGLSINGAANASQYLSIKLLNDGVWANEFSVGNSTSSAVLTQTFFSASMFNTVIVPTPGSHTFKFQMKTNGVLTGGFNAVNMFVLEL